jgi:gas vesicle protein
LATAYQEKCPICGNKSDNFSIDNDNLLFLNSLANEKKINAAISMTRTVWESAQQSARPKMIADELSQTLLDNTQKQLNRIVEPMKTFIDTFPKLIERLPEDLRKDVRQEFNETKMRLENEFKMLSSNLKETLKEMGFPEPGQLKLLADLAPSLLPLLDELVRSQKVPGEKGRRGERELLQELGEYYPEDEFEYLGGPGDSDIIAIPRFNGTDLNQRILIESKKNGSGWSRSFIRQVRKHMQLRGDKFAILAVDVMPKGSANGFLFEQCLEGVILVTDRVSFTISYGAIRSALVTLDMFRHEPIDFRKLFADQKIKEAIKTAYGYCEWLRKIKERAQRIGTNAQGIKEDIDQLDKHLKQALGELQTRIDEAILQMTSLEQDEPSEQGNQRPDAVHSER